MDIKERKINDFDNISVFFVYGISIISIIFILLIDRGFDVLLADTIVKAIIILDLSMILKFFILRNAEKKSELFFALCFISFSILIILILNLVNHPEYISILNSPKLIILFFFLSLIFLWTALIFKIMKENNKS